jgi:predicted nicotinamide N-methyase
MRAGGTSAITALLKSSDEDIVDAAAAALTNLSSPSVRAPEDKVFDFNGMCVRVKEMSFSQSGTAYNVWTAAMVLANWMTKSADFAAKNLNCRKVLELGSGLGVCGIVAAKLLGRDADCEVTLSDFLPHVLDNLQTSIASNGLEHCARCVRLNWADEAGVTGACSNQGWYAGEYDAATDKDANRHLTLEDKEQFDLIIGSDICYENDHPALLEHVVRRRLAHGGRLIFVYAVRFPALHSEMLDRLGTFCRFTPSQSHPSVTRRTQTYTQVAPTPPHTCTHAILKHTGTTDRPAARI